MKKILLLILIVFTGTISFSQTVCNPGGNVFIYSNYDGGELNIDVDLNIPNIKIGVVGYEATRVNITGTFSGNVTEVIYAGYPSTNSTHCSVPVAATSVNGVSSSIVSILSFPAATYSNPNGYNSIICNYSCNTTSSQGGCNTADQVAHYFLIQFSGSMYSHLTQYGCWVSSTTYRISDGGNCCAQPAVAPVANFTASATTICEGECIDFTDNSTGTPTSWTWTLTGAATTTSSTQNPSGICYLNAGSYTVTLTASNAQGTSTSTSSITVTAPPAIPVINLSGNNLITSGGSSYQWNLNGTPISGATTASYAPTANGNYTVTITNASGCSSTSLPFTYNSVSINETNATDWAMVFPVPATEFIHLKIAESMNCTWGSITDINGKIILKFPVNTHQMQLDISSIPAGTYILTLTGSENVLTKTIQIQ
ncbi:MAG TPA: PKD domain-containing protein [Flavobacteriales bacterium]|nr:PKD domain-containing protein [Flavobacteriales bacterium]HRJ35949.1 PKD domain-containing protein [Flavobacteriales bacterium]HRJ38287.1 PKD domain-containing protein [Flavobacteriales bacterium]